MLLGLVVAAFLIFMVLLATSSWSQWRLSEDSPLDVDESLPLPWAGYGSSVVSLSALFGAYSATLLILGPVSFVGIVTGVLLSLLFASYRLSREGGATRFQEFLYGLQVFEDPVSDRVYWVCLAGAQVGLAVCELLLLRQVFKEGLGLTSSYAVVATLSVALVCYFYCLLAGYQAVFRTDVLQYIVLVVMGLYMLSLAVLGPDSGTMSTGARSSSFEMIVSVPFGRAYLAAPLGIRLPMEFLVGVSLGTMPVLGAPDTWKRLLLLQKRTSARKAQMSLIVAAATPVALVLPLFFQLAESTSSQMFPLRFIFSVSAPFASAFLLLGMISAFMSTFDSSIVSGTHLLLKVSPPNSKQGANERQRYHVILGAIFLLVSLLLAGLAGALPHPYAVGIFLLGPVGIVVGLLAGTMAGCRTIRFQAVSSACAVALVLWLIVFRYYSHLPEIDQNPAMALVPVGLGAGTFFLFLAVGYFCSQNKVEANANG